MRSKITTLSFIVVGLILFGCNLKIVNKNRVLSYKDGWFFISDNNEILFLEKVRDDGYFKGFFTYKYDKGFRDNLIRVNYDTCASFLLRKNNYISADSLSYQSFLYDREKIRVFEARIYYRILDTQVKQTDTIKNRYEFFHFKFGGNIYKAKIDRYSSNYVIGLSLSTSCNSRFH
ncbi:MAG: hypothetical protein U0U70_17525 [Chitinophagaceae bacterium]